MKKNILLYKTSRAFTRFLKSIYLENYSLRGYNRYNFEEAEKDDYVLAFILIENIEDLVAFASIYSKSEKVYIISNLIQINDMLSKLSYVTILDNNLLRNDIISLLEQDLKFNNTVNSPAS